MARRLVAAGLATTVFDVVAGAVDELVAAGRAPAPLRPRRSRRRATWSASACATTPTCAPSCSGDDGPPRGRRAGQRDRDPQHDPAAHRARGRAGPPPRGVGVVDACVTGGAAGRRRGHAHRTWSAASGRDLERCRPVFDASRRRSSTPAPLGSGAATKLCNNLMTYLALASPPSRRPCWRAPPASRRRRSRRSPASNGNLTEPMRAFLALHKLPEEHAHGARASRRCCAASRRSPRRTSPSTLAFARECGVALPGTARRRSSWRASTGSTTRSGGRR